MMQPSHINLSPTQAYRKAVRLSGTRYTVLERIISQSPQHSYLYARCVLQARFILGEPAIKSDEKFWDYYQKYVLPKDSRTCTKHQVAQELVSKFTQQYIDFARRSGKYQVLTTDY